MSRLFFVCLILLVLLSSIVFGAEDACVKWFKSGNVRTGTRACFLECSQIGAGMGTWMCPQRCHEFCGFKMKVHLFFGNGMFTSPASAQAGADALKKGLDGLFGKYPDLRAIAEPEVRVAFNTNEDALTQLHQVFTQKVESEEAHFFRWLSGLEAAPFWFRNMMSKIAFKEVLSWEEKDIDLKNQVAAYRAILERDDGVIVVSHSQGNLYSHAAYNRLGRATDFRIIPVASPFCESMSEKLYNGHPYTTLASDGVIRLIPWSYPPNVANPNPGMFDHFFIKHYLKGQNSGPKILSDVMCVASVFLMRLRPPTINWWMESDWDHPACRNLTPHPDAVRDAKKEAEEERRSQ